MQLQRSMQRRTAAPAGPASSNRRSRVGRLRINAVAQGSVKLSSDAARLLAELQATATTTTSSSAAVAGSSSSISLGGGVSLPGAPSLEQLQARLPAGAADAAQQLLDQVRAGVRGAVGDAAPAAAQQLLDGAQPHFGSRAAAQLLQRARDAAPSLPQPPSVRLPHVDLPSVQLPSVQLPSVTAPGLPDGGALLQGASQLPAASAQRLELLRLQLQEGLVAATTGGGGDAGAVLEPHFGSRALVAWLQEAATALSGALHLPVLQLPPAAGLPGIAPGRLLLLNGLGGGGGSGGSGSGLLSSAAAGLGDAPGVASEALAASWRALGAGAAGALPADAAAALERAAAALAGQSAAASAASAGAHDALAALAARLAALPQTGAGGYDFATLCVVAAGAFAAIAASVPPEGAVAAGTDDGRQQQLPASWDPDAAAAYFARRPVAVARRAAQLAAEAAAFGLALLSDAATGRLQANERPRAQQLRAAIERLGPAYVKVAQALSTRVDLLSPPYFEQIQLLQDRVPPFPCDAARAEMAAAFGRPVDRVFASLSDGPVAAASLGQVYKGTLRPDVCGGGEVAVKVLRPGVLEQVSLDLHLMRAAAAAISASPDVRTDWPALIDTWAGRFLAEMDYVKEADNAELFREQMQAAGVAGIVTADVLRGLSSGSVLTTAWVDGEKLSELSPTSTAAEVRELCDTLLSAYLIQLLDTGHLHADPHPGNLIRTPEGKICVLDFGLVTEVTPEQRLALVEYISHLLLEDWEGVARDLQTLGFIPYEAGDPVAMGMAEPLGRILVQLSGGGGASKLNIDAVMAELEALGATYPFSIPPFFALILRAFSVIEGIALTVDPDYSIVKECFPYLARRLLADDDPRVRAALRDVLYGGRARLDIDRLARLSDAFGSFTVDGLSSSGSGQQQQQGAAARSAATGEPVLPPAAKDALLAVFSRRGSYVQELLVEELVAAADALSREALGEGLRVALGSPAVALAMAGLDALGPLRPLAAPLAVPLYALDRLAPAVALTPEDEEALGVVRGVFELLQRAAGLPAAGGGGAGGGALPGGMVFSTTGDAAAAAAGTAFGGGGGRPRLADASAALAAAGEAAQDAASLAGELRPLLPELLPGLSHTARLFVQAYTTRVAQRWRESLDVLRVEDAERAAEQAQAMAALGFMPLGLPQQQQQQQQQQQAGAFGAMPTSANGFGAWGQQQQQQQRPPGALGFAPGSGGSGSGGGGGVPTPSPAQLIVGLAAAPLLMPMLVLSEMQRRARERRQ